MAAEPKVQIKAVIRQSDHEKLKEIAQEQDRPVGYLVRKAVERFLMEATKDKERMEILNADQ